MIALLDHQLKVRDRFEPESMSLSLEERQSSASVTVGPEAPEIVINDWLRDETEPGAGIVWRVRSVSESVETRTRTLTLEHVIQYLKDFVIFGEVKAGDITGTGSSKCTAKQAATYALKKQSLWTLGGIAANPSNPYSFNGDSVYAALETITESMPDMQWEYDLTSLPFKLHIVKQPTAFTSEMRMRRNISTMKVQIDRTRMYTRLYPIGKNNLHISGNYVSKNESIWGTVCKVETDSSIEDAAELKRWAQARLERHCEPVTTITVTGLELSAETGEPLDHIVVGRVCRMPLPEYGGVVMKERVTKLSWADKVKEPRKVNVTLANNLEDVASIVNSQSTSSASSSRGSRVSAVKNEKDHAWFLDTTTHVGMVAEAVAGPGAAENWSRVASVIVDGKGIHQRVQTAEGDIVTMWSSIEVLEDRITLEVANVKSDTYSRIEQTASRIETVVARSSSRIYSRIEQTADKIETIVANTSSKLWSGISQTSTQISLKVGKGEIISCINQTAEDITIQANRINLSGYVKATDITADYIQSKIADLSVLRAMAISSSGNISVANGYMMAPYIYLGVSGNAKNMAGAIQSLQIQQDGNSYTLRKKDFDDADWVDVGTFSRATTLSGEWSGSTSSGKYYKVTASPQGDTMSSSSVTAITSGSKTWATDKKSFSIGLKAVAGGITDLYVGSANFDTTTSYDAGVSYAKPVSWTDGTQGSLAQFTAKATSTGGGSASKTYYLVKNGNYVEVREGRQTGTRVARIAV